MRESLACITHVQDNDRKFIIKILDGEVLGRPCKDLIDAQANRLDKDTKVIDIFQLPDWKEAILPDK